MPLRKAVRENRYEIAEFLVESGMRPDPESDADLLYAALENQSIPMLRLLLPFFDLNRPGADGRTPLFYPQLTKEQAECLVQAGAKADLPAPDGILPYQAVMDRETSEYLEKLFFELHPVIDNLPAAIERTQPLDWSERFTTNRVTIADLVPVDCDQATGKFKIRFDHATYRTSERFLASFARKLKFSSNIFNYFTAEEVFERVQQRNPDVVFKVTFDRRDGPFSHVSDCFPFGNRRHRHDEIINNEVY